MRMTMVLVGVLALGMACGGDSDDDGGDSGSSGSGTSAGTESGDESGSGSGSGSETGTGTGGESFPCDQACECGSGEICVQTTEGCGTPDCIPSCYRRCAPVPSTCGITVTCECIPTELCPTYGECSVVEGMVRCDIPGA